jgi:inner membrane protein
MTLRALAKPALVGFLALLLFIPVGWIQGLVGERQMRSAQAVAGIAEGWGLRQGLAGPYLAVPYEHTEVRVVEETVDGKPRERRTEHTSAKVHRIPADAVEWSFDIDVSEKARGIYKARLYGAKVEVRGRVAVPARYGLAPDSPTSRTRAYVPRLVVGISDAQGIRAVSELQANAARYTFQPGASDSQVPGGLHVPLPNLINALPASQTLEFAFTLELGGSEILTLSPYGADATVRMRSDWPHPSFAGRFLPLKHDIGAEGFSAEWKISRYGPPGVWPGHGLSVGFVEPAGLYQRLERASKYGFLFIGLTFAAFLLFEILRRLAIHPIQYALVGLALAMFFLLLVALSEHIAFAAAYAIATFACVGLITAYLTKVLGNIRIGLAFGAALAAVYAMLYALLQAEDYALLGGALLLFALLAAVMTATRRVDWYTLAASRGAS